MQPFTRHIPDAAVTDLRERLSRPQPPDDASGAPRTTGTRSRARFSKILRALRESGSTASACAMAGTRSGKGFDTRLPNTSMPASCTMDTPEQPSARTGRGSNLSRNRQGARLISREESAYL